MPPKTSGKAAKAAGKPPRLSPRETRRRRTRGGRNPMPSTSTRSSSRFTLTPVSPQRPWASWTPLSTISSSASLPKLAVLLTTTRGPPSPPGKSKLLSGFSSLVSLPSTPCLKAPRLSPSTPAPSKLWTFLHRPTQPALLRATKNILKRFFAYPCIRFLLNRNLVNGREGCSRSIRFFSLRKWFFKHWNKSQRKDRAEVHTTSTLTNH